ncbi:unnamed protein product [Arabidopsis halleri]
MSDFVYRLCPVFVSRFCEIDLFSSCPLTSLLFFKSQPIYPISSWSNIFIISIGP